MDPEIVDPACNHIYRLPDYHHSVATASCESRCLRDQIPLLAIFRAPYVAQLSVRRETDLAGQQQQLVVVHHQPRTASRSPRCVCSHLLPVDTIIGRPDIIEKVSASADAGVVAAASHEHLAFEYCERNPSPCLPRCVPKALPALSVVAALPNIVVERVSGESNLLAAHDVDAAFELHHGVVRSPLPGYCRQLLPLGPVIRGPRVGCNCSPEELATAGHHNLAAGGDDCHQALSCRVRAIGELGPFRGGGSGECSDRCRIQSDGGEQYEEGSHFYYRRVSPC